MTGERIPERIRERAEELAGYLVGNDTPTEAAIVAVARALLAERERCALIVKNYHPSDFIGFEERELLVEAIRA